MKPAGKLPTPRLTATVLPLIGAKGRVIVHGSPGWRSALAGAVWRDRQTRKRPA
ncbi:MAG: hypothetical protein ACM358_05005 [Gemmatimonadota bacterium]